jgi:pimeloyl-ACP methyl ester carboxylesterase
MQDFECKFERLPNGLRMAYVEQGPGDGPAMVLLHGFTDSHRSFDLLRPHLPHSWRAIAPTARGHGRSDKPEASYELSEMAADVRALLDVLGVERAVVVGHSMGAAVATLFAAAYPERTAGLVLVDGFASFRDNEAVAELAAAVAAFSDAVEPAFARAFQESACAQPVAPDFIDMVVGESLLCPARVWKAAMAGMVSASILEAALRVQAQALLIYGDRDAFVPIADQVLLRDALPSAQVSVMSGVGHTPQWERPEEAAALIRRFLDEALQREANAAAA